MNERPDSEKTLAAWFDEGPMDLPDATRRAIITAIPTTPQARRGLFAPRRFSQMNTYTRLVATAFVAVIAVGGALYLLGPRPGVGGNPATPTLPSATPSPSPLSTASQPATASLPALPLDTSKWTKYPASRYGYSMAYPDLWMHAPATEDWAGQTSNDMWSSPTNAPWADKIYDSVRGITMTALAATVPAGTSEEAFIDAYLALPSGLPSAGPSSSPTCVALAKDMTSIVIDGHPARLTTSCGNQAAFVFVGNRMFVFAESDPNQLALLNAFLSTIKLPAAAPSAS